VGGRVLIQITPQMRILVAIESIDGRKGIDSLAQLCREKLDADPFSGCLFIFRSRSGKSIRILAYDSQGFWLATKRLSKGRFRWWPTGAVPAKAYERTRRRCSWWPAIRRPKPRRCGGA
jgi:transposase